MYKYAVKLLRTTLIRGLLRGRGGYVEHTLLGPPPLSLFVWATAAVDGRRNKDD